MKPASFQVKSFYGYDNKNQKIKLNKIQQLVTLHGKYTQMKN